MPYHFGVYHMICACQIIIMSCVIDSHCDDFDESPHDFPIIERNWDRGVYKSCKHINYTYEWVNIYSNSKHFHNVFPFKRKIILQTKSALS